MTHQPAFQSQHQQEEAVAALIGSFGYGGEQNYHPPATLTCPWRGAVRWADIPYTQARELIVHANEERTIRRHLDEASPVSEAEVVMLAALLYYGEQPLLQHPVGPYDLDFYIEDYAAAIEVGGLLHHDRERDKKRDKQVFAIAGITTHRVPARDVMKDPLWAVRYVCSDIISTVISRRREAA